MVEELKTENIITDEQMSDSSKMAGFYKSLFSIYCSYLQLEREGKSHLSIFPNQKEYVLSHLSDRECEEFNSYVNLKAIESVRKTGGQITDEAIFADNILSSLKDSERHIKTYRWENEGQRAVDMEISRQEMNKIERENREQELQSLSKLGYIFDDDGSVKLDGKTIKIDDNKFEDFNQYFCDTIHFCKSVDLETLKCTEIGKDPLYPYDEAITFKDKDGNELKLLIERTNKSHEIDYHDNIFKACDDGLIGYTAKFRSEHEYYNPFGFTLFRQENDLNKGEFSHGNEASDIPMPKVLRDILLKEIAAKYEELDGKSKKIENLKEETPDSINKIVNSNSGDKEMSTEKKETELKTEENINPKTETKDSDFEAFLAEIGKENPDMSVIKAGVERFGAGKLSDALKQFVTEAEKNKFLNEHKNEYLTDAQREQFLKTVFPNSENNHLTDSSKKLGFENITGIKNTLSALKDLQTEGVLDAEQINNVMSAKYPPENGKNMAMTVALNVRAAEFKWKKFTNPEDIAIVEHNLQSYSETLAVMGQIEPKALEAALKEPYQPAGMNRTLTVDDLAAKSGILSEFIQKPSAYQAMQAEDALTVDAEGKTVVGGENNGLTVDGAQKPAIKVNAKSPEQEEDAENIANMSPNAGDDKKKRRPFEFEKVKEQDIIQYMFEHWFLEGVSLALKAPFWLLDKTIDKFEGKFDTNMPKMPSKSGQLAKNVPAIKFLNDTGPKLAQNCRDSLEDQVDYYDRLYNTIQENAGKPIDKWRINTVDRYSDKPVLDINNPLDVKKMQEFNKMFEENPEAFAKKFSATQSQLSFELHNFSLVSRAAGSLATAMYMADHPEGPFGPSAEAAIQKDMTEYMRKIAEVSQILTDRAEADYRLKNGLAPDAKLDEKQAGEILDIRDKNFKKFVDDLSDNTKTFRSNLNSYYNAESTSEQTIKLQQVKASRESVEKILSPEYLDSLAPQKEGVKEKPVEKSLLDFTKDFNAAEARDAAFTAALDGNRKIYEGLHTEQEKKRTALNDRPFVKKAKGKIKKLQSSVMSLFKGNDKQK